ncbi:helix-turn-helix domain protein [mine drainage metagenome]|uniref:Helix-turn-helix domain protein n=1 Tax=mine drainage metagenome TaxID=410659 RepID=A0A1J5PRB6_9ZZZZ
MTPTARFQIVHPTRGSEHDSTLLRAVADKLTDETTRDAVRVLIAGMESGGAVVSRLNDLVTPQEAAEFLSVSRQYVDKLIAEGRIQFEYKPASKHRVIRVSDLIAFEQSRQQGNARIGAAINEVIDAGAEY